MHPILVRSSRLVTYAGLWVIVGVLLGGLLAVQASRGWPASLVVAVPLTVVYGFVCLSAWYVSRSIPLETSSTLRIALTAGTAAALTSAAWVGVSRAWIAALAGRVEGIAPSPAPGGLDASVFVIGLLLYLLSIALAYVLATIEQARALERRALEGQVLARESELRSLRAQVDPHFLFNSLNSIGALVVAEPASARRMCLLLADFLRDTLAFGAESRIRLSRELSLAERYLEIERVRFGERLHIAIEADGTLECLVPPLLLQPVIENAVTHGIAHLVEGGTVRIAARRSGGTLTITVENPCDPDRPRGTGTGVGLSNVRSRLRGLYEDDAGLAAREQPDRWRVEIWLPALEQATDS